MDSISSNIYENQEIVIARYNEDLTWITDEPFNRHPITIYNKGPNDNFTKTDNIRKIVILPNVGREGHTILYHIINNYDNLADVTMFLHGSSNDPDKNKRAKNMIYEVEKTNNTVFSCLFFDGEEQHRVNYGFQIDNYMSSNANNKEINKDSKLLLSDTRPYGKWFDATFTNGEKNKCMSFNSIISVSKKHIIQKPKQYYENLLKQLDNHHNPESGHYFERAWYSVFYPYGEGEFSHSWL
uniref:Uncharacterized protein n=1 Tax=viral metagenome TaxID=1070528 RepID=A0A6C0DQQ8_9ZZZZ